MFVRQSKKSGGGRPSRKLRFTGSAIYPQWGLSWTYDRYGNRTNQTVTAGSAPSNSLSISTTTNRVTGPGTYLYDANGNMTQEGSASFQYKYDGENRMVAFNTTAATYTYVGAQRVKKVAGSTTTVYVFSGSKVLAEYVNGAPPNQPTKENVYSGSTLLATLDSSGAPTYRHPDQVSARLDTDSSGDIVRTFAQYPYGEVWYENWTLSKWKFTSYERDSESGLDYAIYRYDSTRIGRFTSPDPLAGTLANPQSLNRYAYVANNPVNLVDPLGLFLEGAPCELVIGGACVPSSFGYMFICFYTSCIYSSGGGGGGGGGAGNAAGGLVTISKANLLKNDKCKAFLEQLAKITNISVAQLVSQLQQTAAAAQNFVYDGPSSSSVPLDEQKFPGASSEGATTVSEWFDQNTGSEALSQQNGAAIFIRTNNWRGGLSSLTSPPFVSWSGQPTPYGMGLLTHELLHKDMVGGGFTHSQLENALRTAGAAARTLGREDISDRIGKICF